MCGRQQHIYSTHVSFFPRALKCFCQPGIYFYNNQDTEVCATAIKIIMIHGMFYTLQFIFVLSMAPHPVLNVKADHHFQQQYQYQFV